MFRYILDRIVAMFLTLFIIVSIAFMVVRLMPGSVYEMGGDLSQTVIDALNAKYHFDEPIIKQYGYFLQNIFLHWDWGTSAKMRPNVPVFEILRDRIPITLQTGVFPIIYNVSAKGLLRWQSMFMPILALAFDPIARVARYLRAELAETMNSEFMLLAKTKGLTYAQSTVRHGLRNSMVPMMNIIIPMFANVLGGSLVVESIFSVPGMGGLMVDSINASDHMLTVAILVFYAMISLITVLIVDISYGIVDPRVRMGGKK